MCSNSESYVRVLALTLLFGMAALACGCGSDVPVKPTGDQGHQLPVRSSPQNTWYGLQWSLDQNASDGWKETIGSSFEYIPDATSEARFPNAFDSWDRESELIFIQTLFAANLEFEADMYSEVFEAPIQSGPTANWESYEYSLQVGGAGGDSPILYRGVANLDFRLEGNFWHLVRWEDVRGGTAPWNTNVILPTLGELRGAFRR